MLKNVVRTVLRETSRPRRAPTASPRFSDPRFSSTLAVKRMDTHGNVFTVQEGLTRDKANRLAKDFEARGHKQTYWVVEGSARTRSETNRVAAVEASPRPFTK